MNAQMGIITGTQVHTTTDYYLFKSIDGNRNVNKLHLNRLKNSISRHYLFTAIVVNERHEIIDGQHRFEAIKELGLPLHYIVCKGYGLNEVHILNQISKTWTSDDYMEGYCGLGYRDYLLYRDFKEKYGFGHNESMRILDGSGVGKGSVETFYAGNFKVKDYKGACEIADKILMVAPFYAGYKRRSFIFAMLLLLKHPNFNFKTFMQKLKFQPTALKDCVSADDYRELIEEIYNHRNREKVNLRF